MAASRRYGADPGPIVFLGETARIEAYALAGATLIPVDHEAEIRAAWSGLPDDACIVVLTPSVARALGADRADRPGVLVVEMPL